MWKRNIHWLPRIHALAQDRTHSLDMCPDQESNLQTFDVWGWLSNQFSHLARDGHAFFDHLQRHHNRSWRQTTKVQIPALLFIKCVTLGKLLHLCGPQFPCLANGNTSCTYLERTGVHCFTVLVPGKCLTCGLSNSLTTSFLSSPSCVGLGSGVLDL